MNEIQKNERRLLCGSHFEEDAFKKFKYKLKKK